jgi:hypothetical protein
MLTRSLKILTRRGPRRDQDERDGLVVGMRARARVGHARHARVNSQHTEPIYVAIIISKSRYWQPHSLTDIHRHFPINFNQLIGNHI